MKSRICFNMLVGGAGACVERGRERRMREEKEKTSMTI